MFSEVNNYINYLVKTKNLPYIDVYAVKGGKPVYRYFTGKNSVNGNEKLAMFSCTKPLTVVCAMKLIEQGKLSLTDKVSKYIPNFKNAYLINEKGEKVKPKQEITVYNLFTMSSGLDYERQTEDILKLQREKYETATTVDVCSTLVNRPLHFEPSTSFLYSMSHDVLGAVIEVITGETLAKYMEENIFVPLEMNNSSLETAKYFDTLKENYDITENGFELNDGSTLKSFIPVKNYSSGGAGLVTTVEDYMKFAKCLANNGLAENGYRLISEKSIKDIQTVRINLLQIKNTFTCGQGKDYGYGLGVRVRTKKLECGLPIGEFGWDGAAGSYLLVDNTNNISIVMGMNILGWPKVFEGEHLKIVEKIYNELKI